MTSNIDATKPTTGSATTQSVRDNFQTAKDEISALQSDVTGKAPLVHAHAGTDISSGTVPVARLPIMVGATSASAGVAGIVPAPASGDEGNFLQGDGTWGLPPGSTGTVTYVNIVPPSQGISITGGPVSQSGEFRMTLSNDLASIEALGSVGFLVRENTDSWVLRSIYSGPGIIVNDGAGLFGGPSVEIDLDTDPGLEFNSDKLRVKAANGVKRTSSGTELDINGLTTENTLALTTDFLPFYDASASLPRKTSLGEYIGRAAAISGSARGLRAYNNSGSPNSIIDVVAEEILLRGSTGTIALSSVSVSINLASSGANGLDTGSESASAYYHYSIIFNPTTVTTAGLFHKSISSPTMPSDYTYRAYVGTIRNNASSNLTKISQVDRIIRTEPLVALNGVVPAAGGTYEAVGIQNMVPPNAYRVFGTVGSGDNLTSGVIAVAADSNGVGAEYSGGTVQSDFIDNFYSASSFEINLIESQTIYWKAEPITFEAQLIISGYAI